MKINAPIWALGTMSGTSLDGVDAAMVLTDGDVIERFGRTDYRPYNATERQILRAALGKWQGDAGVAEAALIVETAHRDVMAQFDGVSLGGFHGQTLAHDPDNRRTHQAGNGARVAAAIDTPVVWDFRSADVSLGGQGAPLAPFFHFACAQYLGAAAPVAFLNLGGVGNLTYVDASFDKPETPGAVMAFDTGPANAPLDDLMMARHGVARDEGGALAASGHVDEAIVQDFLKGPYFAKMPPKSLDRDSFAGLGAKVDHLSDADAAATLVACCAAAVVDGIKHVPNPPARLLVSGGGRRNTAMMDALRARSAVAVMDIDDTGLDGDMLEAQAFAYLAVRVARGLPTSCKSTTGVAANVGGGTLSTP